MSAVDWLVRGTLVDVLTGALEERAVAIDRGEVVGFGEYPADRELTVEYVAPGLIATRGDREHDGARRPQPRRRGVPRVDGPPREPPPDGRRGSRCGRSGPEDVGGTLTTLELPIAGLLSRDPSAAVASTLAAVDDAARDLGLS
jgi:hypothetical protein